MSLQSALLIAASSLDLQQQQTNLIANNIANASTPGYVQETLPQSELIDGTTGDGVIAGQIQLISDQAAANSANQAAGSQAYSQALVNGLTPYISQLGQATDSTSLPEMFSTFSQSLNTLSANPSDPSTQAAAITAAQGLGQTLNTLDASVQTGREQADQAIASDVTTVNSTLNQLAQNQIALRDAAAQGQSTASFVDTQNTLLSTLANIVPIKVFQESNNGLAVTTDQGTTLYDGSVHQLAFTPTPNITDGMSVTADSATGQTGGLSAVTVDGQPISMSQNGDLAGQLELRDTVLPQFANQLDSIAGNLITAFQTADPTVASGQTGLFTAGGAAVDPTNPAELPGLAATIAVNASVDPSQGGQSYRIVAGAQATTQGAASDNSTVLDFIQALQQNQSYDATTGLPASMNLSDAVSQVAGVQQAASTNWTAVNTNRTAQAQSAQAALSGQTGVNVDDQLQRLMVVQQTYQASTEVMQAVTQMFTSLNQMMQPQ
jgi:flagellar hook-associated protein 1 FlgK